MAVQVKELMRSSYDLVAMLVWPIIYSSIAFYLLDAKDTPRLLLSAAVGSAVMLMWSQVVIGSAGALDLMRQAGTLELMGAAPLPLVAILAPIVITSAAFGLYRLVVTLAWGPLAFHIPLTLAHPLPFLPSIP